MKLACIGLLLCAAQLLRAQAPADLDLLLEPTSPISVATATLDTLTNPFDLLTTADTMIYTMIFNAPDTANVDSIHTSLGTTDGGSELGGHDFAWDAAPAGTVYNRNGNTVYFCLPDLLFNDPVYFEVHFTDSSGNATSVAKFNTLD